MANGIEYQNQAMGIGNMQYLQQSSAPLTADSVCQDAKKRLDQLQKMVDTGEAAKPELEKLKRVVAAFEDP